MAHMQESARMNLGETPADLLQLDTVAPLHPETRIINPVANLHNDGRNKIVAVHQKQLTNTINNNTDSRISEDDARNKTKKIIRNLGTHLGNIACEGEIWIK